MSTTGVAPRIRLDGPTPRPPLYTLLSVAAQVDGGDPHSRAGVNIRPFPPDLPVGHDPCLDGTFREKDIPDGLDLPDTFAGFTAYLGEVCTAGGIRDWDEWKDRANVALLARRSYALEKQLLTAAYIESPNLDDDDVSVLAGGAAVPVVTAIGYLEDAIGATAQDGFLHVTPAVAAVLGYERLRDDRGVLRTVRGTAVIVGDGYVGGRPAPDGTPATAAAAGQAWIYATGPVMYRIDSGVTALPETIGEALDRETNEVIYRAEQDLWVAWDKQLQAAVLADWSP